VPATDEAVALALTAADAADDRKASDLQILEVADILGLVDVFLLATAGSDRQIKAVADRIEERLKDDADRRVLRREGDAASGWVLLDYGDLVCHILTAEQREFYDLERLWADVPRRDARTGEALPAPAAGGSTPRTQGADASPEGGGVADLTVDDVLSHGGGDA
jgi:ribosome-associated protein